MIGVSEVDFRVDAGFAGCVEEIGDKWEGITILLRDAIKSAEINTQAKRAILLLHEEDRRSVACFRRADKTDTKILVEEFAECSNLGLR